MDSNDILKRLDRVLHARKAASPADSYVASLYDKGIAGIADKILEEAQELTEAGIGDDNAHIVHEATDLWFHCLVLLAYKNIDSTAVLDELVKRFGISGHHEKRNRAK